MDAQGGLPNPRASAVGPGSDDPGRAREEGGELSATTVYTAVTDGNGDYTLSGLPEGTYTLVPSQGESSFTPGSRTVSVPPGISGQNFVAGTGGGPIPGEMVTVPAGEFQMGCDDTNPNEHCNSNEQPLHTVYLDEYAIDKYEVTNAQYAEFLNAEGNQEEGGDTWLDADSSFVRIHESGGFWQADAGYEDHPVVEVTWCGARAYCQWRGKRLPTEAEWEKAARGSSDTRMYPWRNEAPDCSRLNYYHYNGSSQSHEYCVGDTAPVGSYPSGASPYGALDMAGNVWEWVNDWYDSDYYSTYPVDGWPNNPTGPDSGSYKALRGGSWDDFWPLVRVVYRFRYTPSVSGIRIGFRCAGDAPGR
jgi:formylglycine-generating enzyme required for sulfatase activity